MSADLCVHSLPNESVQPYTFQQSCANLLKQLTDTRGGCSILDNMKEVPVNMANHMADFASQLFGHLSGTKIADVQEASTGSYLGGIFGGAAAAASLAVASQIPLWFCITCPIVLGMLFPFAFNFGLGAVADELCTYYNLPADACTQLWYSAFALAMILSFASVLPIVTICRLAQCAKHVSPSPGM